jgi:hypothetical protein
MTLIRVPCPLEHKEGESPDEELSHKRVTVHGARGRFVMSWWCWRVKVRVYKPITDRQLQRLLDAGARVGRPLQMAEAEEVHQGPVFVVNDELALHNILEQTVGLEGLRRGSASC